MVDDTSYKIAQGYEVLSPKPGKAYPILCEEWEFLKGKIEGLSYTINIYMEIGFALAGVALSTFVTIITDTFLPQSIPLIIAWAVVIVTLMATILCVIFAFEKEKIKKVQASEIIEQMEIIEKRYQQRN